MALTRAEQEIVAVWDAESRVWTVTSTYSPMVRRLRRLASAYGLPVEVLGPGIRIRGLPPAAVRFTRAARNRPTKAGSSSLPTPADPQDLPTPERR